MNALPIVLSSLVVFANAGVVRVPKIYNALISSDANLTPSRAYPVLEPVYRTTALGVAFPPIVVHPALVPNPAATKNIENDQKETASTTETNKSADFAQLNKTEKNNEQTSPGVIPELAHHGTLYPLAFDPYFPYAYTTSDFLFPSLPFYQQPIFTDFTQKIEQKVRPKPTPTNHKKSDIPDVPPPPLPVKSDNKRKA